MSNHRRETAPELETTERLVTEALLAQADRVEPDPAAYVSLATRVADAGDRSQRRGWLPSPRLAFATTAAAAVVVGGFALMNNPDSQSLESVEGTTAVVEGDPTGGDPISGDPAATDVTVEEIPDGTDPNSSADGSAGESIAAEPGAVAEEITGPVRADPLVAGQAFLDLLDVRFTDLELVDDTVIVRTLIEGSTDVGPVIAALHLVQVGDGGSDGWAVSSVSSEQVSIDRAEVDADGGLIVAGRGTGFEATIDITVHSAVDGSVLATQYAMAGNFGELEPYETELELVGSEQVWLIVSSSGGADDVAEAFAVEPLRIDAAADPTPYLVVAVAPDDPDRGLNLRAEPSASSEKLATLGWGSEVTRTPGRFSERSGTTIWWPVTTAEGVDGWVNPRFLAAAGPEDTVEVGRAALAFMRAAGRPDAEVEFLPISQRLGFSVVHGGRIEPLSYNRATDGAGWTDPLDTVGEGRSLADLISGPADSDAEYLFTSNGGRFVDPSMQDLALTYFGGLPYVTASYTGADGQSHHTHLFIENGILGPEFVGAIIEVGQL